MFCEEHCKTCIDCLTRLCEGCFGDTLLPRCGDCIREGSDDDEVIEVRSDDDDNDVEIANVAEPWFLLRNQSRK